MYFPSKKDYLFRFLIWGTIIICFLPLLIDFDLIAFIMLLTIALFLVWFWYSTGYIIENETLIIKFGPIKQKIKINDIRKLSKSKSILSSPALSMDRIEIMYKQYDIIYISPLHKEEFIHYLKEVNPNIQVDQKLLQN